MKFALAALALLIAAPAFANQTVPVPYATCENLHLMEIGDDSSIRMKPTGITVKVEPARGQSQYGYQATISSPQGSSTTTDVYMLPASPGHQLDQVKQMAAVMAPEVDWNDVAQVIVSNVGVKANRDDAAGIYLFDLQKKDGTTLVKLATYGWGFGRCEK